MHFIFLQPELRTSTSSHYFQYIESIRNQLRLKGHASQLIANELFSGNNDYDKELAFVNRPIVNVDPLSVLKRMVVENWKSFREFKKVLRKLSMNYPSAIFFVDTIQNDRILGLAASFRKVKKEFPGIRLVVVFRFTYRSNSKVLTGIQKMLHRLFVRLTDKIIRTEDCFLLTDSALLQKMYAENLSKEIELMPIPLSIGKYEKLAVNKLELKNKTTLGFIGGTVGYKGLDKVLNLILNLDVNNLSFFIHGVNGPNELMKYAGTILDVKALIEFQSRMSKIITYFRPEEELYLKMFGSMDMIVIPYESLQFAEGTSNVFAEAISLGIIPIVPCNTWMGAELAAAGLSELSVDFSQPALLKILTTKIISEKANYHERIGKLATKWRNFHSAENFANKLIELLNRPRREFIC